MSDLNLDPISTAIKVIVAVAATPTKKYLERNEKVIQVLHKLDLTPAHPPKEFIPVYRYTLVKYGVDKPLPLLNFFRQKEIVQAFQSAFDQKDESIVVNQGEDFLDWNILGDHIRELKIDIRSELAEFKSIFIDVSNSTRTTAEVIRDQRIDDLGENLEAIIDILLASAKQWSNFVSLHGVFEHVSFILEDRKESLGIAEPDDTYRQEIHLGQGFQLVYQLPFLGDVLLAQSDGSIWASTRLNQCKDEALAPESRAIRERFATVSESFWRVPTSGLYLREKTNPGLYRFALILSRNPFPEKIKKIVSQEISEFSLPSLNTLIEYIESDAVNIKLIVAECDIVR